MTHWHFPTEQNIPSDLLDYVGSPLLARLLCQRGIMTVAQEMYDTLLQSV
jgi:hypothetical protein